MSSRRLAKIAEAIREQVSSSILLQLRDPRIDNVTVLRVEVSGDVRSAKVYVSIMGDEAAQTLCMHGLESARGFLQSKVADRLKTKNTPILKFVNDQAIKKSIEASRIIREALDSTGSKDAPGAPDLSEQASDIPDAPATD